MLRNRTRYGLALPLLVLGLVHVPGPAGAVGLASVLGALSDRLERTQYDGGMLTGAWPGEEAYTGSIVAGLVTAYELTCDEGSKAAAISGGDFILRAASGNFYGDEAYALACLSRTSENSMENPWRSTLVEFYQNVRERAQGSTAGYVSQFDQIDLSRAVFYIAHQTVAAFYVGAQDKEIWRQALLAFLTRVDDDSTEFPVMALALTTWAMANIGPLDGTLVDPDSEGQAYWRDVTLEQLPGLLLAHQVVEGDLAGSFYGRFDHEDGGLGVAVAGYADDLAFGALGLMAASRVVEDPAMDAAIGRARNALVGTIGDDGVVPQHLWYGGDGYLVYAAYALRALAQLAAPADVDLSNSIDVRDLAVLAGSWRDGECRQCCSCNRADINRDGRVDVIDLQLLGDSWLQ